MDLKVGVPLRPLGPANTVLPPWLASVSVKVPAVVTGDPETLSIEGTDMDTEVTDPLPWNPWLPCKPWLPWKPCDPLLPLEPCEPCEPVPPCVPCVPCIP